jgi:hypothetical protein
MSIGLVTYRTVEHILTGISAFLDMTLQCTRIEWLQKLETAQQIARNRHDSTPVVEFSAVLKIVSLDSISSGIHAHIWCRKDRDQ